MREDELATYRASIVVDYARQMVEYAGIDPEHAEAKSEQDTAALFPDGSPADGIDVFVIEAEGRSVGYAMLGERERSGDRFAFVYDVAIDEAERGNGFGRGAMLGLEELARARGHVRVELNVFGGNAVARGLYASLGYAETAVTMAKAL